MLMIDESDVHVVVAVGVPPIRLVTVAGMPAAIMLPINVTLEAPVVAVFMRVALVTNPTSKVTSFIFVNSTFPDVVTANVVVGIMTINAFDFANNEVSDVHIVDAAALMLTTAPGE